MKHYIFFLLTILLLTACGAAQAGQLDQTGSPQPVPQSVPHPVTPFQPEGEAHEGQFAIHLVSQEVTAAQLMSSSINELALEAVPILSAGDLVGYHWQTHQMELTAAAYQRLAQLEAEAAGQGGIGFVACVGEERIYSGAFWSSLSSAAYPGLVIDLHPAAENQPLTIQLGYPSAEWFTGDDARADIRIQQSLQQAGQLN